MGLFYSFNFDFGFSGYVSGLDACLRTSSLSSMDKAREAYRRKPNRLHT